MVPVQQADAVISQANPVSTTLYEVLATTKNVRIISMEADITWAVTQPTPLEIVMTIDGIPVIYRMDNPVSGTGYKPRAAQSFAAASQYLTATAATDEIIAFLCEGRSVRVQVRVTWAVTQPTPLGCRVKYARIP